MNTMFRIIIILSISVLAKSHEKCKVSEEACVVNKLNQMYAALFAESNKLDPMIHDTIEGNLSGLKYRLSNSTVIGFKNCIVEAKTDFLKLFSDVTLLCPGFLMEGKYNINGQLFILPVEGNGNFTIETKKYRIEMHMNTDMKAKDGKTYMNVKSFSIDAEALEPVVFKLDNLFNGNKELAEAVLKYANENWAIVANLVQGPVFQAGLSKIIKVGNEHLK